MSTATFPEVSPPLLSLQETVEGDDMQNQESGEAGKLHRAAVSAERAAEASDSVAGLVGQELDTAVAERVMGFKVGHLKRDVKQENPFDDYTPYRNNRTGELMSGTMYSNGMAVIGRSRVPRYSSDIAAAMQVVEKMITHGKSIQIRAHPKRRWNVQLVQIDRPVAETTEDTLPEAICRAALQATATSQQAAYIDNGEGPTGCMDGDELARAMRGMTQQDLNRILRETLDTPERDAEI